MSATMRSVFGDIGPNGWQACTYVHEVNVLQDILPIFLGKEVIAPFPSHRPVYQVEVDIIQLQVGEGSIEGSLDIVGVVLIVPEFGRYKKLFSRHATLLDCSSYSLFGQVSVPRQTKSGQERKSQYADLHSRRVNVAVSYFESFYDGVFLGMLVLPSSEANSGNLRAGVELEFCHFVRSSDYLQVIMCNEVSILAGESTMYR